jgi:nanoRNase/pAp phosphatase (c-di-AMP/oligoRNAs hydrolase)
MDFKRCFFLVICDELELIFTLLRIQKASHIKIWTPQNSLNLDFLTDSWYDPAQKNELFITGDVTDPSFYVPWQHPPEGFALCVVVSFQDPQRHAAVRKCVFSQLPLARVLSFHSSSFPQTHPSFVENSCELALPWHKILMRPLRTELRHMESTHRIKEIRALLEDSDKIALLLQPDPDPDGLASALALRILLGRNKTSTPILSFGRVTRPENLAMMKLLDLEVLTVKASELATYDRVVLLDTQPAHFKETLPRVDAVIDHHPVIGNYTELLYCDIRPKYGATATILTEYLRAAGVLIGQRLATALLYGIKADTLHLNREVIDADLDAFVSLYPDINYNLLRRMEKPELPVNFAPILAHALKAFHVQDKLLVSCIGKIEREDLIPQIADFMLQFEGVEWVVCVGIFESQVVMSVRNVGYVKNAGEVVRRILNDLAMGSGGGHRTMAKAIFSLQEWKKHFESTSNENIRQTVLNLFREEVL